MKIITMTLLKLDKNQQKERENVNTTDLALARRLSAVIVANASTIILHIAVRKDFSF